MDRFSKNTLTLAALMMIAGIALGAFGAHGLKARISADNLETFHTGVLYHLLHGLAIALVGCLHLALKAELQLRWVVRCFVVGVLCFSGSIYLLATSDLTGISSKLLGPITPIGGMFFLVGWSILALKCFLMPTKNSLL